SGGRRRHDGKNRRPRPGDIGHAHSENSGFGTDAWIWCCRQDRRDEPERFSRERRIAFCGVSKATSRWADQQRVESNRKQPASEVLRPHGGGTKETEERNAGMGAASGCDRENTGGVLVTDSRCRF